MIELSSNFQKSKFFLLVIIFLLLTGSALAAKVGVVVEFKNGDIYKECIDAAEDTNGYDLLQKSKLDILWSPDSAFGRLICRINGEGTDVEGSFCAYFGEFWSFNIAKDNDWIHSPVGHNGPGGCWNREEDSFVGHYCVKNGDVLGYKFTDSGEPPFISFDDICSPGTRLSISNAKVLVNGKRKTSVDEQGGTIEAKPGSTIKLEIEISNKYSKSDGTKIENINVDGSLDISSDPKDESNEFDLRADDKKTVTLNFKIPDDEPEGTYSLEVNIEGKDANNNRYDASLNFDVDIEKEKHKISFNDLSLMPSVSNCNANALLNLELSNLGDNDESGSIRIANADLGIDINLPFSLLKDSAFKKTYKLQIGSVEAKTYPLEVVVSYNNDLNTEKTSANLVVKCGKEQVKIVKSGALSSHTQIKAPSLSLQKITTSAVEPREPFILKYKVPIIIIGAQFVLLFMGIAFLVIVLRR